MTDKVDSLFKDILSEIDVYSFNAEGFVDNIKKDIDDLNKSIETESSKIDKFKIGGKVFLAPNQFRDTYRNIKLTGGSKQDINNMIYTIEKMQKYGIHRDFFPKLLQILKKNN